MESLLQCSDGGGGSQKDLQLLWNGTPLKLRPGFLIKQVEPQDGEARQGPDLRPEFELLEHIQLFRGLLGCLSLIVSNSKQKEKYNHECHCQARRRGKKLERQTPCQPRFPRES